MLIQSEDRWDIRSFNEAMEYNPDLAEVEKAGSAKVDNYAEFVKDIFLSMFKFDPKIINKESVPPESQWSYDIYNEITQLSEWKTLRARTKVNTEASAAATETFCRQFLDALPNMKDGQTGTGDGNIDMSAVRRVAREACKEAADDADQMNNALGAFGFGGENGRPQYASPTAKKEAAARLANNRHLKQIAELAGRMRRIAVEKQKQKTKHGVDELADITLGDDLARLVPSELMKLAHPLLKMDFNKRYLEKQLVQYQLRGREKLGSGPLVVCIDESGSMRGEKDIWSKAVGMALLQIAQQQNRKYVMIHFSDNVGRVDKFSGKTPATDVMDAVAHFEGGGTDFMGPLDEGLSIIAEDKEFKNADLLLITDGESEVTEKWLAKFNTAKKELQFQVISIVIEDTGTVCNKFSDKVVYMNIGADSVALNTMFSI